uniref:Uncharacterized protein n=1 Tax=Nothobranchius kuhntae TaxID=321403 RepID=A0A1A8KW26_NOTKU
MYPNSCALFSQVSSLTLLQVSAATEHAQCSSAATPLH